MDTPGRCAPAVDVAGAKHRRKGDREERAIVGRLAELGLKAERYPLSGASRFRGSGHDLDIYVYGPETAPLVFEVKARKNGAGFAVLERWLGEFDGLITRQNNSDPLVTLRWEKFVEILLELKHRS